MSETSVIEEFVLRVYDACTARYGLTRAQLARRIREQTYAEARIAVCYVLRQSGLTFAEIAEVVERNYTTVMSNVERAEQLLPWRWEMRQMVADCAREGAALRTLLEQATQAGDRHGAFTRTRPAFTVRGLPLPGAPASDDVAQIDWRTVRPELSARDRYFLKVARERQERRLLTGWAS